MKLKINGQTVTCSGGTILDAARENGIRIPTLCHLKERNDIGACRVCLVSVKGMKLPQPACVTQAAEDMEIKTDTPELRVLRRRNLELICADHRMECTECPRGMDCELRELCKEYEVDDKAFGTGWREKQVDATTPWLVRDNSKCILCRRCVNTCKALHGIGAIAVNGKSAQSKVGFGVALNETDCVGCGQCVTACPTGALYEKDDSKKTWKPLLGRKMRTVAVVSPFVCAQIGELFGETIGTDCRGKTAALLRRIGFDEVYLSGKKGAVCAAWRNHLQKHHPELAAQLPKTVTPGAAFASEYREKVSGNVHITVFSPCLAAKSLSEDGVDVYLTTRELAAMWKRACVSNFTAVQEWGRLPEEFFDVAPFALHEPAAKTTACGIAEGERLLQNGMLEDVSAVIACPGGCVMGGGAPHVSERARQESNTEEKRSQAYTKNRL